MFGGPDDWAAMAVAENAVSKAAAWYSRLPRHLGWVFEDKVQCWMFAVDAVAASWNAVGGLSLDLKPNLKLMDLGCVACEVSAMAVAVDYIDNDVHNFLLGKGHSCCSNFRHRDRPVALTVFVGRDWLLVASVSFDTLQYYAVHKYVTNDPPTYGHSIELR